MKFFAWILGNKIEPGIKIPKSPHEIFPKILHWKEGDEIENWKTFPQNYYHYKSVSEKGIVTLLNACSGTLEQFNIKKVSKMFNQSLHNRNISKEIEETEDYMQLMKDFQKAYKEISGD